MWGAICIQVFVICANTCTFLASVFSVFNQLRLKYYAFVIRMLHASAVILNKTNEKKYTAGVYSDKVILYGKR